MSVKTRLTTNAFETLKGCVSDQDAKLWLVGHAVVHPSIVNLSFDAGHPMGLKIAADIDAAKITGKTGQSLARLAQELRGGAVTVAVVETDSATTTETTTESTEEPEPAVAPTAGEASPQDVLDFVPARESFVAFLSKLQEENGGK